MKGGVPSPGHSCARPLRRPPGLALRAGRAAGTGWRVQRRLNLQEDILIRSGLPQPSAAAGGRTDSSQHPLPPNGPGPVLAGRETEMVAAETGARRRAAARGRALGGLCCLLPRSIKPSHVRDARAACAGQPAAKGRRWAAGRGRPGWGRAQPPRRLPAPSRAGARRPRAGGGGVRE